MYWGSDWVLLGGLFFGGFFSACKNRILLPSRFSPVNLILNETGKVINIFFYLALNLPFWHINITCCIQLCSCWQSYFSCGQMWPKRLIYDWWFLSHNWMSPLVPGIFKNYLCLLHMVYIYVLVFKLWVVFLKETSAWFLVHLAGFPGVAWGCLAL